MRIDLRSAHLLDPALGIDRVADVLIEDGRIAGIGSGLPAGERTIGAEGMLLVPGLCDIHVHLREPGQTHKEDIRTGLRAARLGGFTDVCAMPNTAPPMDRTDLLQENARRAAPSPVRLHQLAAITAGQNGEHLAEIGRLQQAGAVGFTDDGRGVASSAVMRLALQYARDFGAVIAIHAEDPELSRGGVMHEGEWSYRLGLPAQPRSAESAMVARDIELLRETGGRLHVCHVSARQTVELVRRAKEDGLAITAEVTPHHLLLTDEDAARLGTNGKMNPPLRTAEDRDALIRALADGTIDAIATDHAPHGAAEKALGWLRAPFGVIGLETAFPSVYTALVQTGRVPLARVIDALTASARRVYGLAGASIREGAEARLTLIDLAADHRVDGRMLRSKSQNSAFLGRSFQGWPQGILTEGEFHHAQD